MSIQPVSEHTQKVVAMLLDTPDGRAVMAKIIMSKLPDYPKRELSEKEQRIFDEAVETAKTLTW